MTARPRITPFLHERSSTITYLVADEESPAAAIIDPTADLISPLVALTRHPPTGFWRLLRQPGLTFDGF